ncbi:hypothetical protein PT974_04247 [Cladobotryum mycophilum]|uniref:Sec39 domain-containing protein n=1 Tax=Cladobotryum mycophilum TaxID=491253 RepID=A0ABR0SUK7_9HYPO
MSILLSPAKVVLLAAHFTAIADIESLSLLAGQRTVVLHKELLLRILLTFLPETLDPTIYVGLLQELANGTLKENSEDPLDITPIEDLSDEEASKRAKKLRLLQLSNQDTITDSQDNLIGEFLIQRAYRIDREAGPLSRLPNLLIPFLHHAPAIRSWVASTVIPYLRRNFEYYTPLDPLYSLIEFQKLPDRTAAVYLLSQIGYLEDNAQFIGRDLRGIIGPWLQDQARWKKYNSGEEASTLSDLSSGVYCPGWEQVMEWLISQPLGSSTIAVAAVEQWGGPEDIYLGEGNLSTLTEPQQQYLKHSFARAGLASVYLASEATVETLAGAYQVTSKLRSILDYAHDPAIDITASNLPNMSTLDTTPFSSARIATCMRNDLLQANNPLTSPTEAATSLLLTLITSAFLCTRLGSPLTVKKVGDLAILQNHRDQKVELKHLIRAALNNSRGDEDSYWTRMRREILWLRTWSAVDDYSQPAGVVKGIFGTVPKEFIEGEILKALLSKSRCALARAIYEDGVEKPLVSDRIQEIVYDIHAFPKSMSSEHPATKQIEALLRCTHALGDYRLVLKQGEPFSPVLLRVHSDPVSIIEKVLEQNPKAYTRLQEFLEMASNMVYAGIASQNKPGRVDPSSNLFEEELAIAEKRIVAMCIEAALREDDFETAYSYVVSRVDSSASDRWSWNAALKAGQYIRTERTLQPTHLGTASGNPEIRHLEQRIECLATALRVAPASQLQEILKTFRRCEEQLDFAIKEETASENAWEISGEVPGAFQESTMNKVAMPRNIAATAAAKRTEDAPMSLFDLSRATARVASQNFTRLPSLPSIASVGSSIKVAGSEASGSETEDHTRQRTRKRDQLREAATGTLVSGVGWLIGANTSK